MSPRILRNTFCRRQPLAVQPSDAISELLGFARFRTCSRIAAAVKMKALERAPARPLRSTASPHAARFLLCSSERSCLWQVSAQTTRN